MQRLYAGLTEAVGSESVFLVVDELGGVVDWPSRYSRVAVTPSLLTELGLHDHVPEAGWLCGDYCYYAMAQAAQFDYMWLIEADVQFVNIDLKDFFRRFADCDLDFVARELHPAEAEWCWGSVLVAHGLTNIWRCLFCLTRASRPAISAALKLRREVATPATRGVKGRDDRPSLATDDGFTKALPRQIDNPNDESVFATAVAGMRCGDLQEFHPDSYKYFSTEMKYLGRSLVRLCDGPQVIHGALSDGDYTQHVRRRFAKLTRTIDRLWMIEAYKQALHPSDYRVLRHALPLRFRTLVSCDPLLGLASQVAWRLSPRPD